MEGKKVYHTSGKLGTVRAVSFNPVINGYYFLVEITKTKKLECWFHLDCEVHYE